MLSGAMTQSHMVSSPTSQLDHRHIPSGDSLFPFGWPNCKGFGEMDWLIYLSCLSTFGTIRAQDRNGFSRMTAIATESMRNNIAMPGNERLVLLTHLGGG